MIVVVVERKGRGGSRWGQQETLARQLAEGVAQRWKAAQSTEDEARDSAGTSVAEEMVEKLWRVQEARRIGERNADDGGAVLDEEERARLVRMYGTIDTTEPSSSTTTATATRSGPTTTTGGKDKEKAYGGSEANRMAVQEAADRQRAEMKAAHRAKAEQDKKDREKQRLTREEKKAKRRAACQKVERRR